MANDKVIFQLENVAIITQKHNYIVAVGPQRYVVLTPDELKEELENLVERVIKENKING